MNAPLNDALRRALETVSLDDKYTLERGRIYISGTQALVRLPMLQQERDRASPLGALDQALWKAKKHLSGHSIVFQAGLNEDLAATSVWGSQQVNLYPSAKFDGVFGMWYGKGPGVDRTIDVFKHANSAGSSAHGGVLVLAGDDHACKSSTLAHQSEHVFKAAGIPVAARSTNCARSRANSSRACTRILPMPACPNCCSAIARATSPTHLRKTSTSSGSSCVPSACSRAAAAT